VGGRLIGHGEMRVELMEEVGMLGDEFWPSGRTFCWRMALIIDRDEDAVKTSY
jgi:hypothetical protein